MKAKIKPKDGLIVRNPETKIPLSKDGEVVELNNHWNRRLAEGDVVLVQDQKPADKAFKGENNGRV